MEDIVIHQPARREHDVRIGNPEDVDEMMKIAMMATEENGLINPNPIKLLNDIWPALNRHQGVVGIIGKKGGEIEGAILLRVGSMWYSDELIIEEKAIFIHPEFRSGKGGRAARLCDFSKSISDRLGLPLVIGVLSNHRTEAKIRMYHRQFGKPNGAYWIYNGRTGILEQTES